MKDFIKFPITQCAFVSKIKEFLELMFVKSCDVGDNIMVEPLTAFNCRWVEHMSLLASRFSLKKKFNRIECFCFCLLDISSSLSRDIYLKSFSSSNDAKRLERVVITVRFWGWHRLAIIFVVNIRYSDFGFYKNYCVYKNKLCNLLSRCHPWRQFWLQFWWKCFVNKSEL